MQNDHVKHSAEGSTWTKKNHKYIRKEGNRYIYPEDLKRISQQHANRNAAANGKIVNPSYTLRDKDGTKIARLQSKDKVPSPNQADYKQYSKEMSNQAKQKRAAGRENYKHDVVTSYNGEGAHKHKFSDQDFAKYTIAPKNSDRRKLTNMDLARKNAERQEAKVKSHAKASNMSATEAKRISQQRSNRKAAANGVKEIYNFSGEPDFHVWGKSDQENAKRQGEYARRNHKRAKALNKQGSVNRQQEAKDFKEYQDWEKADQKKRDTSAKRQKALNNQGKVDRQDQTKHTLYEKKLVERKIPETKEYEKIEVEKTDKSPAKSKSRTSKLKDRVSKAISNLKSKKSKKKTVNEKPQEYDRYDDLIKNASSPEEKKRLQQEKGRKIGTRHYTNDYGVEYDEDVYTNSRAAQKAVKNLDKEVKKRGKIVQVSTPSDSIDGWNVDYVTPENVKAKNYYNRKRKKN